MPNPIDDLRWQLTEAALQRSWKLVNDIIIDLEERGVLFDRLQDCCGPATRVGCLSEWLQGCADWEEPATVGASP
jgi:hypothetical protein